MPNPFKLGPGDALICIPLDGASRRPHPLSEKDSRWSWKMSRDWTGHHDLLFVPSIAIGKPDRGYDFEYAIYKSFGGVMNFVWSGTGMASPYQGVRRCAGFGPELLPSGPGTYRLDVLVGGAVIASQTFEIYE